MGLAYKSHDAFLEFVYIFKHMREYLAFFVPILVFHYMETSPKQPFMQPAS